MEFIEGDSIRSPDVSPGRTNSRIVGQGTEYKFLNEKTSQFDILFRVVNPLLTTEQITINLHIGIEPQKNYRPGYAIEKRGIYYLSRELSSQLSPAVTEHLNYGVLEKCYSIWICSENVPVRECNTISFYGMENRRNIGNCFPQKTDYDLLELIIIRLGKAEPETASENHDLVRFLRLLFLPHKEDVLKQLSDYIDFSANEDLMKEVIKMDRLGMEYFELGMEEGFEKSEIHWREQERHDAISRMLKKLTVDEVVELGYDRSEVNSIQEETLTTT